MAWGTRKTAALVTIAPLARPYPHTSRTASPPAVRAPRTADPAIAANATHEMIRTFAGAPASASVDRTTRPARPARPKSDGRSRPTPAIVSVSNAISYPIVLREQVIILSIHNFVRIFNNPRTGGGRYKGRRRVVPVWTSRSSATG
jgi:hypothetical protein